MAKRTSSPTPSVDVHVPLRMPRSLADKLAAASARTGLSKQNVMRLSLERGVDILVSQLNTPPAAPALAEAA